MYMLLLCLVLLLCLAIYLTYTALMLLLDAGNIKAGRPILYEVVRDRKDVGCIIVRWSLWLERKWILLADYIAIRKVINVLIAYAQDTDQSDKMNGLLKLRRNFSKCVSHEVFDTLCCGGDLVHIIDSLLEDSQ